MRRPTTAAGYSGKPLIEKLGLKPGQTLAAIDAPAHYHDLVSPLPEGARVVKRADAKASIVHLFAKDTAALKKGLDAAVKGLPAGAALWISWPKTSSPRFVDLTEDGVRAQVLPTGLVDVKVAAVDEDWSGLKFLRRKT
jgi:hypothetical protein